MAGVGSFVLICGEEVVGEMEEKRAKKLSNPRSLTGP